MMPCKPGFSIYPPLPETRLPETSIYGIHASTHPRIKTVPARIYILSILAYYTRH